MPPVVVGANCMRGAVFFNTEGAESGMLGSGEWSKE